MPSTIKNNSNQRAPRTLRYGVHGFTLMEMLVVIALMALVSVGVVFVMGDSGQDRLQREGVRLAAQLGMGMTKARLQAGRDFGPGAKEFNQIRIDNGRVTIGASVTITEVKDSDELNQLLPGLGNYLNLMASTPIRNMATVGGNIANGSPIGDVSVMLMGLDATLVLSNKGIKREVKLRDFFVGYKKVAKDAEELVECVYFDKPNESTRFSF